MTLSSLYRSINCFQNQISTGPKTSFGYEHYTGGFGLSGKDKAKLKEHWIDWMVARFRVRFPVRWN